MKISIVLLALVFIIGAAMTWQHLSYVEKRRVHLQDNQASWYSSALHIITYLTISEEAELVPALTQLKQTAARNSDATWVYAGKVIFNPTPSPQITEAFGKEVNWNAIVLQQFDDRAAYDEYLAKPEVQEALVRFDDRLAHGMHRPAPLNIALHQFLLAKKIWRAITFAPDILPLRPSGRTADVDDADDILASLLAASDGLGKDAIMIVNLMREGSDAERAANADYAGKMLDLMAELGYGPMHLGGSVPIDHDLKYDSVALVYYPGAKYFHDLVSSTYFQGIIGDKQLGDTQVSITVPLNSELQ